VNAVQEGELKKNSIVTCKSSKKKKNKKTKQNKKKMRSSEWMRGSDSKRFGLITLNLPDLVFYL